LAEQSQDSCDSSDVENPLDTGQMRVRYLKESHLILFMKIILDNIGWVSKVAQKRATLSISISKLVAVGCGLHKGQPIFSYLGKDENNRPIIICYLDGKER
jgi:hypothetical protein